MVTEYHKTAVLSIARGRFSQIISFFKRAAYTVSDRAYIIYVWKGRCPHEDRRPAFPRTPCSHFAADVRHTEGEKTVAFGREATVSLLFLVILPMPCRFEGGCHVNLYKITKIFKKPLTAKESCGIMASPLRRAFLMCPKSCATRRARAPGEGGTRQAHFRETANNFYGRCRYHG